MMEIFHIMSIIGSKMSYSLDDGACIKALNSFKAYLYLAAPPSLRTLIEKSGENKDTTGKVTKISWFQKATGKLQRIFAPSSMLVKLDSLFSDIITAFLLTTAKFNIVTSIHSDVLQTMKLEILKLDEVVSFFNKIRVAPTKKCATVEDCRTDEEIQADALKYAELLEKAKASAKISDKDVTKNLVQTGQVITKVEASGQFKAETTSASAPAKGLFSSWWGTKKGGRYLKAHKKRRTKKIKSRV